MYFIYHNADYHNTYLNHKSIYEISSRIGDINGNEERSSQYLSFQSCHSRCLKRHICSEQEEQQYPQCPNINCRTFVGFILYSRKRINQHSMPHITGNSHTCRDLWCWQLEDMIFAAYVSTYYWLGHDFTIDLLLITIALTHYWQGLRVIWHSLVNPIKIWLERVLC